MADQRRFAAAFLAGAFLATFFAATFFFAAALAMGCPSLKKRSSDFEQVNHALFLF
jgi:preprotein translocase subunit SecG